MTKKDGFRLQPRGCRSGWNDLRVQIGSLDRPGISDPAWTAVTPGGGAITTYLPEFAKNDFLTFTIQIPHTYVEGQDIYVHLHWTPGARGVAENGNKVGWKVDYCWANVEGTFGAMVEADLSDACNGANWEHNITPEVKITGTNKKISSMLLCVVTRIDTGTDDTWSSALVGEQPLLLEVDFHIPVDSIGSSQIYAK